MRQRSSKGALEFVSADHLPLSMKSTLRNSLLAFQTPLKETKFSCASYQLEFASVLEIGTFVHFSFQLNLLSGADLFRHCAYQLSICEFISVSILLIQRALFSQCPSFPLAPILFLPPFPVFHESQGQVFDGDISVRAECSMVDHSLL